MIAQMFNHSEWIENTDPLYLNKYYEKYLLDSGFKILNIIDYHFEPQGYTALYLLSESHFAIHTFPEESRTYIELSSCIEAPFNKFTNKN